MADDQIRFERDFKWLPKELEPLHDRLALKLFKATITEAEEHGWTYSSEFNPKRKTTPLFNGESEYAQTELVSKMVIVNSVLKWMLEDGWKITKEQEKIDET